MDAAAVPSGRLYADLAHLWPLVSPPSDYAQEAACWRQVLRERLGPGRHAVLELGVGGGHNLSHLTADFDAVGVDLSETMLDCSRSLNPGVEHIVGDMRSVRLGRKFAAVLIHDAISNALTEEDLSATFATARAHLEVGGIVVVAPDDFRETFHGPRIDQGSHADGDRRVTYFEYAYDPDPDDTTIEVLHTFLVQEGDRLFIEHDRHRVGLFPRKTWLDQLARAGFETEERSWTIGSGEYRLLIGTVCGLRGWW